MASTVGRVLQQLDTAEVDRRLGLGRTAARARVDAGRDPGRRRRRLERVAEPAVEQQ